MSATPADPLELQALEERFYDVICDDEELLTAEFDAIVTAGWGSTRPVWPCGPELRGTQADSECRGRATSSVSRSGSTEVPARARQRSPPTERENPSAGRASLEIA